MIVLITSHAYTHHCISLSLTCWFSNLYTILIVFKQDVCITIHLDCHSLYVYMSDISCTLLDCMVHDYPPFVWLHVACPCGSHFYPPTSKSLGFSHSFYLGSHYCKCETFCVLALWPSQRLGVRSSDRLYRCTGALWEPRWKEWPRPRDLEVRG